MKFINTKAKSESVANFIEQDIWTKEYSENSFVNKTDVDEKDVSVWSTIKLVTENKIFSFMNNTTMHGMKYIFMRKASVIRR